MPVVVTTAYGVVEDILLDARAIVNDMAVQGGDVLTDDAPFSIQYVNLAYRRIQSYLAQYGVETYATYQWLLGIPPNLTGDCESRVMLSDSGTQIITPSGQGESSFATPVLPDDLVAPLRLRERLSGCTTRACWMTRPNDGLTSGGYWGTQFSNSSCFLRYWDWLDDTLWFYGCTQSVDIELKYEKHLPILSSVTDTVPIRGVDNAAAQYVAYLFSKARGASVADSFGEQGQAELDLLVNRTVRARQRIKVRRRPFRGGGCGYRLGSGSGR